MASSQPIPQSRPQERASSSQVDQNNQALNISMGVEFELIILESLPKRERRVLQGNDHKRYGLALVHNALKSPIQLRCTSCKQLHEFSPRLNVQDGNDNASVPEAWNILAETLDLSKDEKEILGSGDLTDNVSYDSEVTSRILFAGRDRKTTQSATDPEHTHTVSYKDEIEGVLDTLQQAFNEFKTDSDLSKHRRLVTNDSCGFHVHVGNGSDGFPLQTVKNVLSIYVAFERLIDSMHAITRIWGNYLAIWSPDEFDEFDGLRSYMLSDKGEGDSYNVPLSAHFINSAAVIRRDNITSQAQAEMVKLRYIVPQPPTEDAKPRYPMTHFGTDATLKSLSRDFNVVSFVNIIQRAPDINTLTSFFRRSGTGKLTKNTDVNIANLYIDPREPNKDNRTIEFRQHAGVMTAKDAFHWMGFLQSLVRYAHDQSAASIATLCSRAANEPAFSLRELLGILKVDTETINFYIDLTDATSHAAEKNAEIARENAKKFGDDNPLKRLVDHLISKHSANYKPENVSARIKQKFKIGGYGQFSRTFIDEYYPDLTDQEKQDLTIPSTAPAVVPSLTNTSDTSDENKQEVAMPSEAALPSSLASATETSVPKLPLPPVASTTSSPKRGRDSDSDENGQQTTPKKRASEKKND